MPQIILASQSTQRKNLMATLGIPFEVIPADIDEQSVVVGDLIKNLAERARVIALKKAQKIAESYPQAIIIAADTYGDLDGQPLEKPNTKSQAKEMLLVQSGKWLKGYTGFAYLDGSRGIQVSEVAVFEHKFRDLTEYEIDFYVENNPVTTWSAAFSPAYDGGAALIETMKGSFTAFTHGLPVERVVELLRESGGL